MRKIFDAITSFASDLWDYTLVKIIALVLGIFLLTIITSLVSGFIGSTYKDFRPNNVSYKRAIKEFKFFCDDCKKGHNDEYSTEYYKWYENQDKAINDFMHVAETFNVLYSDGKFWHIYLWDDERVYVCNDKDEIKITLELKEYDGGINWKPEYEVSLHIDKI